MSEALNLHSMTRSAQLAGILNDQFLPDRQSAIYAWAAQVVESVAAHHIASGAVEAHAAMQDLSSIFWTAFVQRLHERARVEGLGAEGALVARPVLRLIGRD